MRWFGIIAVCLLEALISLGCHHETAETIEPDPPVDDPVWFRDDTDNAAMIH